MNRAMVFAEGTANLMQRLSRLPTAPDLGLLRRRKTIPSSWSHEHHLQKQMISNRWCCIHRLSSHGFSVTSQAAGMKDRQVTGNPVREITEAKLELIGCSGYSGWHAMAQIWSCCSSRDGT